MSSLFPMEKWRLVGTILIMTVGLTPLAAVLGAGPIVPVLPILGLVILAPLVAVLGSELPFVAGAEAEDAAEAVKSEEDPVERLRNRYAQGELSKEEFEARLDRLLETEGLSTDQTVESERELLLENE